jgi:cytidylate kinase
MINLSHPVIAVDGTAASGKSTFSRQLAERLGYVYVNTGAMYRGVTWFLLQRGVPLNNAGEVTRAMAAAGVATGLEGGELVFRIGGDDPLPYLREAVVNEGVSLVAQVPEVRRVLVAEQQKLAVVAPLVMEGRDIGSVVFPHTPYKFFLDASPDVRVQRRSAQGEVDVIQQRDVLDSQRKTSPLLRLEDACYLDSGALTVEAMVEHALLHLARRGLAHVPERKAG